MKWLENVSLVAALGMFVGCASDPPTNLYLPGQSDDPNASTGSGQNGPPPETAQAMFTDQVYPSLNGSCGECHISGVGTPYFLGSDATSSYSLVKGLPGYVTDPAQSRLILKGVHYANQGPALTADQTTMVTQWLTMELTENPANPGDPAQLTPLQELELFGKCMSFTDWETYNVVALSNEQAIYQNNSAECDSCHENGEGGTCISAESLKMFEKTKTVPYILKFAAATLNEDGTFDDIARTNRWVEKCVEEQLVGNPHPPCVNGQIALEVVDAINLFFDATYTRWMNGECDTVEPPPEEQQ